MIIKYHTNNSIKNQTSWLQFKNENKSEYLGNFYFLMKNNETFPVHNTFLLFHKNITKDKENFCLLFFVVVCGQKKIRTVLDYLTQIIVY